MEKRERTFKLSLHAFVTGIDAKGDKIKEHTDLYAISAEKATFSLKSRVTVGVQLHLALSIPKTLILEKPLTLIFSGKVIMVQGDNTNKSQMISIKPNRAFKINSLPSM